jgi:hypothetical protein
MSIIGFDNFLTNLNDNLKRVDVKEFAQFIDAFTYLRLDAFLLKERVTMNLNGNEILLALDKFLNDELVPNQYKCLLLNKLFPIVKRISESVNGSIYILTINTNETKPLLVCKKSKSIYSDSLSYEYYVGIVLNQLRLDGNNSFALTFGKILCDESSYSSSSICGICGDIDDQLKNLQLHVFSEYISSTRSRLISLEDLILNYSKYDNQGGNREQSILKVLCILLLNLKNANERVQFTHYDLHLKNVLIIDFHKYTTLKIGPYTFSARFWPVIIDFGRSHVSPSGMTGGGTSGLKFKDYVTNKEYNNLKEFQRDIFNYPFVTSDESLLRKCRYLIHEMIKKPRVYQFIRSNNLTESTILETFFLDENNYLNLGITPIKQNINFDVVRLVMSTCVLMKTLQFKFIMHYMEEFFPFYIPEYFHLPREYDLFGFDLNKFINLLYKKTSFQTGGAKAVANVVTANAIKEPIGMSFQVRNYTPAKEYIYENAILHN